MLPYVQYNIGSVGWGVSTGIAGLYLAGSYLC